MKSTRQSLRFSGRRPLRSLVPTLFLFVSWACGDSGQDPNGLRATPAGNGPVVNFDIFTRPFPDIPFPNDIATTIDVTSPTGRRLNLSTDGETRMERDVRARLNALDGFGTYQPITVTFDKPLDLDNLIARHQNNLDFSDDAVYLVNIDPQSPEYGKPVLVDMGRGNFPALLKPDTYYFPSDPREAGQVLLFETDDEDRNGNGALDPGEDTDNDGVLDKPNVWPPDTRVADGLLTFYERESNTLILRPVVPLSERSEYAVVLTDRLLGANGEPVRSPFKYVHHQEQTARLGRLADIFASWRGAGWNMSVDEVAFAWVFTTQSVTADLVAARQGLYGYGPLSWLADRISDESVPMPAWSREHSPSRYVLDVGIFQLLAAVAFGPAFDISPEQVAGLVEDLNNVAYIVQGSFASPDFIDSGEEYIWDNTFDIRVREGTARVKPDRLFYTMAIPKTTERFKPPFPVAVYGHGFGQARIEFLGFAGILARYGIASIGIDSYGHGLYLKPDDVDLLLKISGLFGFKPFIETLLRGRARDLDGDGKIDAGGDTFSAYAFHSRDTVRQSVVDTLQLVRVLKQFDGVRTWDWDEKAGVAGDFDGDGNVDAGGPDNPYFVWGSSMGGIQATIIGALEPAIIGTAPVAGGAGLTNLASRSQQVSVCTDTVMRILGPVIIGEAVAGSETAMRLSYVFAYAKKIRQMPIAEVTGMQPGYRIRLVNVDQGKEYWGTIREGLSFNLHMKADRDDRFLITLYDDEGNELDTIRTWDRDVWFLAGEVPTYRAGEPLRSPAEGWGLTRGSPDLRRLTGLAQAVLEPGDPINYASHHFLDPLSIAPEGAKASDLLVIVTLGDPMNPTDIHAAKARAAGILDYLQNDPRYGMSDNDWLIQNWVYEGICGFDRFPKDPDGDEVLFDPDSMDHLGRNGDNGFGAPDPAAFGEPELRIKVSTPSGMSGIRFAHMRPCGKHSFFITDPSNAFNVDEYLTSLVGYWFATQAQVILDDGCHEDSSCVLP